MPDWVGLCFFAGYRKDTGEAGVWVFGSLEFGRRIQKLSPCQAFVKLKRTSYELVRTRRQDWPEESFRRSMPFARHIAQDSVRTRT